MIKVHFTLFVIWIIEMFSLLNTQSHRLGHLGKYYQPSDKFSFTYQKLSSIRNFYNRFERLGDVTVYKDRIKIAGGVNNTFGMFYTKEAFEMKKIELQISFKYDTAKNIGSSFGIFFFKDDPKDLIISGKENFIGFSRKFNGFGIILQAPPVDGYSSTEVYAIYNNGTELYTTEPARKTAKEFEAHCQNRFKGGKMKFFIRFKLGLLSLHDNIEGILHHPCFEMLDIPYEPPYRIAVSSFNGVIDGEFYNSVFDVEKFILLNGNFDEKHVFATAFEEKNKPSDISLNDLVNSTSVDIISTKPAKLHEEDRRRKFGKIVTRKDLFKKLMKINRKLTLFSKHVLEIRREVVQKTYHYTINERNAFQSNFTNLILFARDIKAAIRTSLKRKISNTFRTLVNATSANITRFSQYYVNRTRDLSALTSEFTQFAKGIELISIDIERLNQEYIERLFTFLEELEFNRILFESKLDNFFYTGEQESNMVYMYISIVLVVFNAIVLSFFI